MSRTPLSCSIWAGSEVTTTGTSCRFCSRFWAVTTSSSMVVWAWTLPAPAARARPVAAVIHRLFFLNISLSPRLWRRLSLSTGVFAAFREPAGR